MLNITVRAEETGLTFSNFEQYGLPAPPSGANAEINDSLILKFEDEEEAITYADQLQTLSDELNDKSSAQYRAISDIILAIRNDDFIQSYNDKS